MTLKKYILYMLLATSLCWLSWVLVLFKINPLTSGILGVLFFYLSLFLSLIGSFALMGLLLRAIFKKQELMFRKVLVSFRQGVFFALVIIISLFLFQKGLFAWWNALFLIIALSVLEFFFLSRRRG